MYGEGRSIQSDILAGDVAGGSLSADTGEADFIPAGSGILQNLNSSAIIEGCDGLIGAARAGADI